MPIEESFGDREIRSCLLRKRKVLIEGRRGIVIGKIPAIVVAIIVPTNVQSQITCKLMPIFQVEVAPLVEGSFCATIEYRAKRGGGDFLFPRDISTL